MNPTLKALYDAGQSIWLDNIRRSMFASGELHRLIDAGVRGMTSNPTIFEKAIASGNEYDLMLGRFRGDFLLYSEGLHHGQIVPSGLPARISA